MDSGTWEVGDVTSKVTAHHVGKEVSVPALPGATRLEEAPRDAGSGPGRTGKVVGGTPSLV